MGAYFAMAPEAVELNGVELDPVAAAITQALYPDAPDTGRASVQPDSEGILRVTQDGSARRPDIWADLEAERQILAALPAAGRTSTAQDQQAGTAADQTHPESIPEDSHARAIRDRLAHLIEQSRARRNESEQALARPFQDRQVIASGPPRRARSQPATSHPPLPARCRTAPPTGAWTIVVDSGPPAASVDCRPRVAGALESASRRVGCPRARQSFGFARGRETAALAVPLPANQVSDHGAYIQRTKRVHSADVR
ncbi:hypothetical protein ACIHEJ_35090 [Streptomyces sp. NPDC052301]|uniref:hypothetical protein n=1 Tax=Streptomyces sp. NPDC052301 TaxID=3365687 RepID=UPI0037D43FF9